LYGTLRFATDFTRGDDPDFVVGPITASQAISLVLIAGSLLYLRRLRAAHDHRLAGSAGASASR